jgi:toxic protein SymE
MATSEFTTTDAQATTLFEKSVPPITSRRVTVSSCAVAPERVGFGLSYGRSPPALPFLRLRGRWLERAGFTIGSKVRVAVSEGRLVLEAIPGPGQPAAALGVAESGVRQVSAER